MGYTLCIAEKPSVAKDIARVIGAHERKDGYFIGSPENGYIVTWAVGHLVGLAEPHEYGYIHQKDIWDKSNPGNGQKAYDELPLFPDSFKTVVLEDTAKQFKIIKDLMHRSDVDIIIDCGDMGPEGHILQWLIREKAGCKKPVKRFCATSLTDEAIKESMNNLRNIEDFHSIIIGEYCKKRADWILGMSMSRCCGIKYKARVDVGRVLSPTLFFVVKRYLEANSFKETEYFTFTALLNTTGGESFSAFWSKDTASIFQPELKDTENRLLSRDTADKTAQSLLSANSAHIHNVTTARKETNRPQLYDITELQRDGNRIFGYTAIEVLNAAQSLYETHKVLSYPRTDSRYITSDLAPYLDERIRDIALVQGYENAANTLLLNGLNIDKRIVDDTKVTDHHALVTTEKLRGFNVSVLGKAEKDVLFLVMARMLISLSPKYVYEETVAEIEIGGKVVFITKGIVPISDGWKAVQRSIKNASLDDNGNSDGNSDENQTLPKSLANGQQLKISDISVVAKKTSPPKLHTEATLLTAMENAGSSVAGGAILKGKGIGTQSTRAAIIKSLFDKGYVTSEKKAKTAYLMPTKQGINVIKALPQELYSPSVTADWELKISRIVEGKYTEAEFLSSFREFITEKVNEVKQNDIKGLDFSVSREAFAACPFCKAEGMQGDVYESKDGNIFYCSNKCGFSLYRDSKVYSARTGKSFTKSQIKTLIDKGTVTANCTNKNGKKYTAIFTLVKTPEGKAGIKVELPTK